MPTGRVVNPSQVAAKGVGPALGWRQRLIQ
jgi:hypothetical protein